MKLLAASLVALASLSAQAGVPRKLGPPEKKPADAGVAAAPAEAKAAKGPAETEHAVAGDPPMLKVGEDAPVFNGLLHNAAEAGMNSVDLSAMVGGDAENDGTKVVLVSFFATWCKPCKKELPFLVALDKELRSQGLRIVSVAIDKEEEKWPEIQRLVKENGVTFPVVKDRYNLIARRFLGDKTALPSVFLVGRDGLVKLVKQGYPNDAAEFLRAEIDKALK